MKLELSHDSIVLIIQALIQFNLTVGKKLSDEKKDHVIALKKFLLQEIKCNDTTDIL